MPRCPARLHYLFSAALLTSGHAAAPEPDGRPHVFAARNHEFSIDGQPLVLVAGEMHFGRVLEGDWEQRIRQAKAMGLNTLSCYLFWNQVEPEEGRFDFSGDNDIRRVLRLAQANGLWVILRPGPYCCAETEFGGIPYWTLRHPGMKVRTNEAGYLELSRRYIERVAKEVADLQVTRGGPLLLVQVENEYGGAANGNIDHMKSLTAIFRKCFEVPLFTCDPTTPTWTHPELRVPGLMYGRNGLKDDRMLAESAEAIGDFPVYVPEVYTAWFSGWGDPIAHRYPIPQDVLWLTYLLDHRFSFCLYLEFGGTNFGFSNGCNRSLPVQTSYDYDAPIDEAGRATERYRVFRDLLTRKLGVHPPPIPADPPVIALPTIELRESAPLLASLPARPTLVSQHPVSMEDLGQAYGFVLYRKRFPNGIHGTLELRRAMDYTVIMANGRTVANAFRGLGPESSKIALNEPGPTTLDLLVYNLGRISVPVNSHTQEQARKGLMGGAFLGPEQLTGWEIFSLPMTNLGKFHPAPGAALGPAFYRGTFEVDGTGGTFLDLRHWSMGVAWVNGHNLGRYWDRGGLRSLFVPRQWLRRGENEIRILELGPPPQTPTVSGGLGILDERPIPFAMRLDKR